MKNSKFTESQIINILKLAESGMPVTEVCRNNGISQQHFINGALNMAAWMPQCYPK